MTVTATLERIVTDMEGQGYGIECTAHAGGNNLVISMPETPRLEPDDDALAQLNALLAADSAAGNALKVWLLERRSRPTA